MTIILVTPLFISMSTNNIYWHTACIENVPGNNDWLSGNEIKILDTLRFLKRRNDWRLGRWTAKNVVQLYYNIQHRNISFSQIEIPARESGAPYIMINNKECGLVLSISHRETRAVCTISNTHGPTGCDLELIEPRTTAFTNDYFTADEKKYLETANENQRNLVANLIWSAKESVSKVLQLGLNTDTRDIKVHSIKFSETIEWNDFEVILNESACYYGKWKKLENYIFTVAAEKKIGNPNQL